MTISLSFAYFKEVPKNPHTIHALSFAYFKAKEMDNIFQRKNALSFAYFKGFCVESSILSHLRVSSTLSFAYFKVALAMSITNAQYNS